MNLLLFTYRLLATRRHGKKVKKLYSLTEKRRQNDMQRYHQFPDSRICGRLDLQRPNSFSFPYYSPPRPDSSLAFALLCLWYNRPASRWEICSYSCTSTCLPVLEPLRATGSWGCWAARHAPSIPTPLLEPLARAHVKLAI